MVAETQLDLVLITPELVIAATALLVIALDLGLSERQKPLLAYLAVLGIVVAAIVVAAQEQVSVVGFAGTWVVDPLARFFKLIFLLAAALIILSAIDYIRRRTRYQGEFYALMLAATLGMMMMASARELLTLYVALELSSVSLFILAAFLKDEAASTEAGMKYLLLSAVSSATLLYGLALTFGLTGTTILPDIAAQLVGGVVSGPVLLLALVFVAAGFGFKVAAVPFHMWAPDVYQGAPTPTTAFLSVASKASGFVVLLRVLTVAYAPLVEVWTSVFAALAAITMTVGNLGALRQRNVKRLLGYSSIGQAGYALMALAALGPTTTGGLLFFLLAYAFTNLTVFLVVIHLSNRLASDDLGDYEGLSRRAPLLSFALLVGLLSLVGMPPTVGFWGKIYLFFAVLDAGLVWLVVIGLLNSALSAYYYLKVVHAMYLRPSPIEKPVGVDVPLAVALAAVTVVVVVLGVAPGPLVGAATDAANSLFVR